MNKSYKGKVLISTPDISGDIFSRSVVLIIDHDEKGAFGMILNKKNTEMSVQLNKIFGFNFSLYEGGPVATDRIFLLIKGKPLTENYLLIHEDYYLTEDVETIAVAFLENKITIDQCKVLSGYSGWDAQQLEEEIKANFWIPVESYHLDFTSSDDPSLWKKIMQNMGGEYLIWANAPEDVHLN